MRLFIIFILYILYLFLYNEVGGYMKVVIERLDHFGRGICYIDNKITFVENALVGEVIDIEIISSKKKYNIGKAISYIKTSSDRRVPPCPYYNECGGCSIQHMTYEKQLEFKENKVKDILEKYADISKDKCNPIVYDKEFNYRNKIILHGYNNNLGLYKKESNDIVNIDNCLLANKNIEDMIKKLNEYKNNNKCTLKQVLIRGNNKLLLNIKGDYDINSIDNSFNNITFNYIEDTILNKKFRISPDSFYQVNELVVPKLYSLVIDEFKKERFSKALDLYCGVGTFGILVSDYVDFVVGIEVVEDAYKNALENRKINNINNIDFICGKVEDYIERFKNIDIVIVDPPRKGLDNKTTEVLKQIKSRKIIYVSCDPMTLARDIKNLNDVYEVKSYTPVDMFPNTYHCESVCILERK